MNNRTLFASLAIVVTLTLVISPFVMGGNGVMATKKHHHHQEDKHNDASQDIEQGQFTSQGSSVFSKGNTTASGNNIGLSINAQEGNNALGQR